MTPQEYLNSIPSTDANCPLDTFKPYYTIDDVLEFARRYHQNELRRLQYPATPKECFKEERGKITQMSDEEYRLKTRRLT